MSTIIATAKTILNALAFSNTGNYSEFRALLRQLDKQAPQDKGFDEAQAQCRLPALTENSLSITAEGHHIQQVA